MVAEWLASVGANSGIVRRELPFVQTSGVSGASVGANSGIVRRNCGQPQSAVLPIASVGANSGIVRRKINMKILTNPSCFSRREFRNREAAYTDALGQAVKLASVGANSGIVRRCIEHYELFMFNSLQSARIQES